MDNYRSCSKKIRKQIKNVVKTEQIGGLRINMDNVAKFGGSILIDKGFIRKKAEDKGFIKEES